MPVKREIKRYNRCMWMTMAAAVVFFLGLAMVVFATVQETNSLDFLLYFGVIGLVLGIAILVVWYTCQCEIETITDEKGMVEYKNSSIQYSSGFGPKLLDSSDASSSNRTSLYSANSSSASEVKISSGESTSSATSCEVKSWEACSERLRVKSSRN